MHLRAGSACKAIRMMHLQAMRLTTLTDYSLRMLIYLALRPEKLAGGAHGKAKSRTGFYGWLDRWYQHAPLVLFVLATKE